MADFKDRLAAVRTNPALMQQVYMDALEEALNDKEGTYDVPDPGAPFPFLLESMVVGNVVTMEQQEAILRRLYPSMALNQDELYPHMSDQDYLGRFAGPAWSTFEFFVLKDEVLAKAVDTGENGVRKLVIPRRTSVRVGGKTFTMQYPIEIRILSHGGIQVTYDTDVETPLQTLSSNMVDWDLLTISRMEVMRLRIPMGQFAIQTFTETLNSASGFTTQYAFDDYFYHLRAYLENSAGEWEEIRTTHSEQVYDPTTPTLVVTVLNQQVRVTLPLVYFTQGLATGDIRVDLYTTQGPIDIDLGDYTAGQYEMILDALDDDSRYVSPLNGFSQRQIINPNVATGGSPPVTFSSLRDRVIEDSLRVAQIPITSAQLGTSLENRGYTLVTNIDNITNRQFLATRTLPTPDTAVTTGGVGCLMGPLQTTMQALTVSSRVKDNGERITLTPDCLYVYDNAQIAVVPDAEVDRLQGLTPDALAREVNNARYLYSPLHYVLDATDNNFDCRAYYLDAPSIDSKTFLQENETAYMEVSIESYDITRVDAGYQITLKLQSGDLFKGVADEDVYIQMGYKPTGETQYASLNGTLVGTEDNERIYRFIVETDLDIDAEDALYTTNFSMFDATQRNFATPLAMDFDVTFGVAGQSLSEYERGEIDELVQDHLLPDDIMLIARERLHCVLGHALTGLWRRNRTLVSAQQYQTWTHDVPYVYEETVYERDENGTVPIALDEDGNITYPVKHTKGDPVLDSEGEPRYRYRKGDLKRDTQGEPVLVEGRKLNREVTLFLVDGVYYFVNDDNAVTAREEIPGTLVGWLRDDVETLQERLLENSELFLHPTATFGDVTATVREGLQTSLAIDQHVYVNYYLTDTAYRNTELRQSLTTSTTEIVVELLGRTTITRSDLITRLKENAGNDVISIEVGGLGGDNDFSTVSITDEAVRLSLRKRLAVLNNQLLTTQDDIDISFLRHTQA